MNYLIAISLFTLIISCTSANKKGNFQSKDESYKMSNQEMEKSTSDTTNKDNLVLPNNLTIQMNPSSKQNFTLDNILIYIKTKAIRKNDFYLGPYFSNKKGEISISKNDLENEVEATYDSGLMDYSSIESNFPEVEICIYTQEEINKHIESRSKYWTSLLKGEEKRWKSINELLEVLRNANNKNLLLNDSNKKINAVLDGTQSNYRFEMNITFK
jgi:hypothetical protein